MAETPADYADGADYFGIYLYADFYQWLYIITE